MRVLKVSRLVREGFLTGHRLTNDRVAVQAPFRPDVSKASQAIRDLSRNKCAGMRLEWIPTTISMPSTTLGSTRGTLSKNDLSYLCDTG